MPLDEQAKPGTDVGSSVIENEIPAYRAIAPGAVFALIFGILAVLSFASEWFLAFAVLAILLGFLAERKIKRMPDLLTGTGLAQAGMGLGLVFGLSSLTISTVQSYWYAKKATEFATVYADVLTKGTFEQAVWWGQPPQARSALTPEKLVAEMTGSPQNAQSFEARVESLRKLKKSLSIPGSELHFERLERSGTDGVVPYGLALYEVHTPHDPGAKAADEDKDLYAVAYYKGVPSKDGGYDWWVENLTYPAKPGSVQTPVKKVDDGHGH